jgi:uncharacterized membrane protein
MPTTRLEAFSDGVFAIAITILVLNLRVPPPALAHGGRLGHLLLGLWPNYASYVVSFLVIGIIWVNHHVLFHHVGRVDRPLLFVNLLLLLFVVAIPFPTGCWPSTSPRAAPTPTRRPHGPRWSASPPATWRTLGWSGLPW